MSSPAQKPMPRALLLASVAAALVALLSLAALFWTPFLEPRGAPIQSYKVLRYFPHNAEAFTQGLVFDEGVLYESTGGEGKSNLRRVDLENGTVLDSLPLPDKDFGEGLTVWKDRLIQLTWRSNVGYVYDKRDLRKIREFHYEGEGWGLTHDGRYLIMSGGSSTLRFLDPETFEVARTLLVRDHGRPVSDLNELEYVKGEVYANVWQSDRIARISPKTGEVLGWIDLKGLLENAPPKPSQPNVLNGIAWDAGRGRLFVTGKLWPWLFQIEVK
jgi:glutamine cyclotransferase